MTGRGEDVRLHATERGGQQVEDVNLTRTGGGLCSRDNGEGEGGGGERGVGWGRLRWKMRGREEEAEREGYAQVIREEVE